MRYFLFVLVIALGLSLSTSAFALDLNNKEHQLRIAVGTGMHYILYRQFGRLSEDLHPFNKWIISAVLTVGTSIAVDALANEVGCDNSNKCVNWGNTQATTTGIGVATSIRLITWDF